MNKTIFFIACSLILSQAYNQAALFSLTRPDYEIAAKLIESDSKILLIGKYDSVGGQYLFFNEYSQGGTFITSSTTPSPFMQGYFSITEVITDSLSNYYFVGTFYSDTTIDRQIGIVKFGEFYDLIDFYILGQEAIDEAVYDVLLNSIGNIIIGGYSMNTNEAFLYEYDTDGNLINEKIYSEDTTWLGVLGIYEDTANNRYISSQTKHSLSILDHESHEIISENTGDIKDSSYLLRYLYSLPATNDFLASYIQYSSFEIDFTNYYISRLTPELDTLWTINFGDPLSDVLHFPNSLTFNESNNIWLSYISCNNCANYLYEETSHTINIKKITSSGNLVGEYYISGDYNFGYLSSSPSSDNGIYIIASLYNWDLPTNDLDIVVFKIDSLGNLITVTDDIEAVINTVNVFPNPANNYLQFHSDLYNNGYQIEFYQADGSKLIVHESASNNTSVNISHLPVGIYFYRILHNGNVVQTGKFVKR